MSLQAFPKAKFHATEPSRTVDSPEAEAALGAGWHDKPAEAHAAAKPAHEPVRDLDEDRDEDPPVKTPPAPVHVPDQPAKPKGR